MKLRYRKCKYCDNMFAEKYFKVRNNPRLHPISRCHYCYNNDFKKVVVNVLNQSFLKDRIKSINYF